MFPNVITPSPLYHSLFRTAHPGTAGNLAPASFLVENLLRDSRGQSLFSRPLQGMMGATGLPQPPMAHSNTDHVPGSPNGTVPYLKFGVNAILGADSPKTTSPQREGTFL